jgi:hypothetical protein
VSPAATALIVFACVFSGALLGMLARKCIRDTHLSEGSRDVINLRICLLDA